MAALDKLINLLEQIKQTDPSFSDKASKALDVLVSDEEEEVLEVEESDVVEEVSAEEDDTGPPPLPKKKKKKKFKKVKIKDGKLQGTLEPEEGSPEIVYPDRVHLEDEDWQIIVATQQRVNSLITRLGLIQQNYEVDKELALDAIETTQKELQQFIQDLQHSYDLDPQFNYSLSIPTSQNEKATFIKEKQ
jgi:hypothetical protein